MSGAGAAPAQEPEGSPDRAAPAARL